jgi:hypothetical protein
VNFEISPQPEESERAAILAALAAEEAEWQESSDWVAALLPQREAEDGVNP